jgi:hypothetical protein
MNSLIAFSMAILLGKYNFLSSWEDEQGIFVSIV